MPYILSEKSIHKGKTFLERNVFLDYTYVEKFY